MKLLSNKEIAKMSKDEINSKLSELRFSLIKANVTANKSNAKTKEIKRAIARLLTFNASHKEAAK